MIKKDDNCYIVDDEEYFSFLKKRKTLTKVIKKSEVKNILFGEVDYKAYISVAKKYNISYDLAKIYVDNALFLKENIDLVSAPNSVKILCEIKEFLTSQNMIYFSSRINILKKGIVLYGNPCDFIDIIPVLMIKKSHLLKSIAKWKKRISMLSFIAIDQLKLLILYNIF